MRTSPQVQLYILDNQYLMMAIELGLVGVGAFVFYLLWPAIAALVARKRAADQELRDLAAALAGGALAAAVALRYFRFALLPDVRQRSSIDPRLDRSCLANRRK